MEKQSQRGMGGGKEMERRGTDVEKEDVFFYVSSSRFFISSVVCCGFACTSSIFSLF